MTRPNPTCYQAIVFFGVVGSFTSFTTQLSSENKISPRTFQIYPCAPNGTWNIFPYTIKFYAKFVGKKSCSPKFGATWDESPPSLHPKRHLLSSLPLKRRCHRCPGLTNMDILALDPCPKHSKKSTVDCNQGLGLFPWRLGFPPWRLGFTHRRLQWFFAMLQEMLIINGICTKIQSRVTT